MKNNLTTTNQSAKLALLKSKSLIDITNKLLANRPNKDLIESFKSFRFSSTLGHKNSVRSVAITQDGKYIVSGSDDETIKLWDIQTGKEVRSFEGHTDIVRSVAITPDGKYIVSVSNDKTIKLWDIQSGALHVSFVSFKNGEWLAWKPNGEYNCSDGAYKYFCFVHDSKGLPEVVDISHPVYKAKKKEILLSNYISGEKVQTQIIDNATIIEPLTDDDIPNIDIDDDEAPF